MADGYPCFLAQIEINATNKYLDIETNVGGASTIDVLNLLGVSSYVFDTIYDLLDEVEDVLEDDTGDDWSYTISATGVITITNADDTFKIYPKTGTHGSDGDDDHVWTVLGFDDSQTTHESSFESSKTAEWQHQYGFYAEEGLRVDSYDRSQVLGGEPFVAESSRMERTSWATHYLREIHLQTITTGRFLDSQKAAADTNEAFDLFYEQICKGYSFAYYTDAGDVPGSLEGTYCYEVASNESLMKGRRHSPGDGYYDISLVCRKQDWS